MTCSSYDRIGTTYAATRRPDPRLAALIASELGEAQSVLNVGAGTGSYEPTDRRVVAVEPSPVMIAQRPAGAATAVQAIAEALPFPDGSFDAAMAILTLHHWSDPRRGLSELMRAASKRVVILSLDVDQVDAFWLLTEYFPSIAALERDRTMPLAEVLTTLGGGKVFPVPIPHDCQDGFTRAFWRRPRAYLDPGVRAGMSTFAGISQEEKETGLRRLREDLRSGAWAQRFGHILEFSDLDLGYRLVVAGD